nr:transporter substrate-binding domain-containing protein [Chthonobacter albigriseus]
MFRTLKTLAVAAFTLAAATVGASAAELPDLKGRTIAFATAADYNPYAFIDTATNQPIGYDIDVVNEAAKRLNATVEWKIVAWDIMLQAIRDKQFDAGADGITITEERKGVVDFSDAYFAASTRMLIRADETRFSDSKSFAADEKLTVVALPGTSQYYVAVGTFFGGTEGSPRLKQFDTFENSLLALNAGDVDLLLTDGYSADKFVAASGGKLKALDEVLGAEEFGFVFPKGSDLVAPFNAAIAAMKADGSFEKLNEKWLTHK